MTVVERGIQMSCIYVRINIRSKPLPIVNKTSCTYEYIALPLALCEIFELS